MLKLASLPVHSGIVLGHLAPDADSVCSCISFVKFLRDNNHEAFFFVPSFVPDNVMWLIEENREYVIFDKNNSFFKNNKNFYVLDCEPSKARTGFSFPKNSNIVNIDHHKSRFDNLNIDEEIVYGTKFFGEVEFENRNIFLHLENRVSTCSILHSTFGIKNPLLAIGIYFDSVSLTLHLNDSIKLISEMDLNDSFFEEMIEKTKYKGNKRQLESLKKMPIWWDDDEEIAIAFDATRNIESHHILTILGQYVETLIYIHKNKNVSIRTSNRNIDLAKLAKKRNGGGHKGASGFRIKSKIELYKLVEDIKNEKVSNNEKKSLMDFEKKLYSFFNK